MANYIEAKVRSEKTLENGTQKKVTETYLVDALSFTEAEARITKGVAPYISGDFTVSAVKKSNISEIFFDETADKYFRCKLNFITLDEKNGCEKRTATHILVQAGSFDEALKNLRSGMKNTMSDYEIASITETAILDVYKMQLVTDTTKKQDDAED